MLRPGIQPEKRPTPGGRFDSSSSHVGGSCAKNRLKPALQTPIDGRLQGLEFRPQAVRNQNENCCYDRESSVRIYFKSKQTRLSLPFATKSPFASAG